MFEDFRKQTDDALFRDDEQGTGSPIENKPPEGYFLGMTPVQRFIVSVLLLMMTVILGILFLLVTSKIVPPFMG
jgi:hypothetical protein